MTHSDSALASAANESGTRTALNAISITERPTEPNLAERASTQFQLTKT